MRDSRDEDGDDAAVAAYDRVAMEGMGNRTEASSHSLEGPNCLLHRPSRSTVAAAACEVDTDNHMVVEGNADAEVAFHVTPLPGCTDPPASVADAVVELASSPFVASFALVVGLPRLVSVRDNKRIEY